MKTVSATTPLAPARSPSLNPLIWWHLLSLDAPTVATVWMIFVARTERIALRPAVPLAMFLAVWSIYALDRLLDARGQRNLEARHRFHGRHRAVFQSALAAAAIVMLPLAPDLPARLRLAYLLLAAALMLWLALIHLARVPIRMPKEIVVGLFFSVAVFLPAAFATTLPRLILPALFFANLCSLNCLFIYQWEHPLQSSSHATTAFGLRHLHRIALASILLPLAVLPFHIARPILLATSLSALALLLLHRHRANTNRTTLRAAADVALLTPLLLLPFLR